MSELGERDRESVFELGLLDDSDPSHIDGFRTVYNREVPMRISQQLHQLSVEHSSGLEPESPNQSVSLSRQPVNGSVESIKVKLLLLGPDDTPSAIRVELSSEADLFFYYHHVVDEETFCEIKQQQNLIVDFPNYGAILIRMLNSCIREPHIFLATFTITDEFHAKLDLVQNMEYKYVELLKCSFERSSPEIVQNQISYRYSAMKHRLSIMQCRLHDIVLLVKNKNPSLLLQLQKTSTPPGSTSSTSSQQVASQSLSSRR